MTTYRRKPAERYGHNWYIPNVRKTGEFRHVVIDTNYWKSFIRARLATPAGDRGCLTLYGGKPEEHRLFSEHVPGAETWVATEEHGRTVHEWRLKPAKPDNHWFDCVVGCAIGASMCGVRLGVESAFAERRRPIRLSDLQKRKP